MLNYFGKTLTNAKVNKNMFFDLVQNCAYVGFVIKQPLCENILTFCSKLEQRLTVEQISNILSVILFSEIDIEALSLPSQKTFIKLKNSIEEYLSNKIKIAYNNKEVSFFPSIASEDRYFHKSLSNTFEDVEVEEEQAGKAIVAPLEVEHNYLNKIDDIIGEQETKYESKENSKRSYVRKGREAKNSVDLEFESFFSKKRDLMYGNQSVIIDDFKSRQTIQNWIITKILNLNADHQEILLDEFNLIFTKIQEDRKYTANYEKFYLKLLSFSFKHNFNIESNYKHFESGIKADYLISMEVPIDEGKKNKSEDNEIKTQEKIKILMYVSDKYTTTDHSTGEFIPDGIFKMVNYGLKEFTGWEVIPIYEKVIESITTDEEFKLKIVDKILK